jgi:hypothetical protein
MLPFSSDRFFDVFAAYNAAVWPVALVALVLGMLVVARLAWPAPSGDRTIAALLAAMWAWTGVVYHGVFFARINPAARGFALLFVLQAVALVWAAARRHLRFGSGGRGMPWLGWTLVAYSLVFYPLVGVLAGHRLAQLPAFGITPCPVTLFTLGVLMLASAPVPWWLLAIPFAWTLVGGSAAFLLGVPQDGPLLAAALVPPLRLLLDRRRDGPA